MAVRIRKDGRIFCAALRPEMEGDTYLDDSLHYDLSTHKVLVTEPFERHMANAEWWWAWGVPGNVVIDDFYKKE